MYAMIMVCEMPWLVNMITAKVKLAFNCLWVHLIEYKAHIVFSGGQMSFWGC